MKRLIVCETRNMYHAVEVEDDFNWEEDFTLPRFEAYDDGVEILENMFPDSKVESCYAGSYIVNMEVTDVREEY